MELAFSSSQGDAGVTLDSGLFRTVFLGFPWEALPTPSDRQTALGKFLDFCATPGEPASDLTGIWWDSSRPGQGMQLFQQNGLLAGAWYFYDAQGFDTWATFVESLSTGNTSVELLEFTGPPLGTLWDPDVVDSNVTGQATIIRQSPISIRFDYALGEIAGSLNLTPFAPNAGPYTGVWWDPSRSGMGLQLVHQGSQLSGAWYLYDNSGQGQWLTFIGQLTNSVVTAELLSFTGPPLGFSYDPGQVKGTPVGSITLQFDSDQAALLSYQIDGVDGALSIVPFSVGGQ